MGFGRFRWLPVAAILGSVLTGGSAIAGKADVLEAEAKQASDGTWTFTVTVQHDDAGWDHYANAWVVVGPDEKVLGERVLLHPHDLEQPFTRSASGIRIPDDVERVIIRAKDLVHGFGGAELTLELPR